METLHLPPELETTTERIGEEDDPKHGTPMGSTPLSAIDF